MTVRQFNVQNNATQTLTTTSETIVLSLPAISTNGPGDTVSIQGKFDITFGTGATGVIVRVRRGSTVSGTLIGDANTISATAANTNDLPFAVEDTPGEVAGQVYVVTVQQVAATANGSVLQIEGEISLAP